MHVLDYSYDHFSFTLNTEKNKATLTRTHPILECQSKQTQMLWSYNIREIKNLTCIHHHNHSNKEWRHENLDQIWPSDGKGCSYLITYAQTWFHKIRVYTVKCGVWSVDKDIQENINSINMLLLTLPPFTCLVPIYSQWITYPQWRELMFLVVLERSSVH